MSEFDCDFAIVGSGFGGSVSALRLSEKGYSVSVLEMGKRWRTEDFPKTNWELKKHLWRPRLGLYGILQMTLLRDVFFLHGCGVGGGSLVYANTLLVPPDVAFRDPQWVGLDWKQALRPHYETANRMLGATPSEVLVETDRLLKEVADEMGRGHTFHRATVGRLFRRGGRDGARPLLRRRRSRADGLHALRRMHGRLPIRRQEHARQELPVARREARRQVHPESRVIDCARSTAAATS